MGTGVGVALGVEVTVGCVVGDAVNVGVFSTVAVSLLVCAAEEQAVTKSVAIRNVTVCFDMFFISFDLFPAMLIYFVR